MSSTARSSTSASDIQDIGELRKRLELAEDELSFLKAVFDEYKDSSAELETELDGQLKDLERSNQSLKRENEQLRAQLQTTIARSKRSADDAASLTVALEGHLDEMSKREKKLQSQCRALENEKEELKTKLDQALNDAQEAQSALQNAQASIATAHAAASSAASEKQASITSDALDKVNHDLEKTRKDLEKTKEDLEKAREENKKAKAEKQEREKKITESRAIVDDAKKMSDKIFSLTQSRFATLAVAQEVPKLSQEELDDLHGMVLDVQALRASLDRVELIMTQTAMSILLIQEVHKSLLASSNNEETKLSGESEHAINASCLSILGKIMVLGDSLPEFKKAVGRIKDRMKEYSSKQENEPKISNDLAHSILFLCQEIMSATFEPMKNKQAQEDALTRQKEETLAKIEAARLEGEKKAAIEAEQRLNKEKAESEKRLKEIQESHSVTYMNLEEARKEVQRIKAESESQLQTARTEAKQQAEKARREAMEQAAAERKSLQEEIYKATSAEMDALRASLEQSEQQYKHAARQQQMYQDSMKRAVIERSKSMLDAMKSARDELEILKRSTQSELAQTQSLLNENLNHVRKVARTIAKTDVAQLSMMYERELEMRVKLQDQVQSLKGNIRVFCRIRPLLGKEIEMGEREAITITDEMTVTAEDPDLPGKPQSFNFDRVFGPSEDQQTVFDEVRTLCLSALDGYNVCLFAYGITGSGKTFTVEGGEGARDNPKLHGLVYRTIKEIFRIAFGERAGAYETEIQAQLLELYNDNFKDLLNDDEKAPKPEVRLIPNLGVVVEPVLRIPVKKLDDALECVKKGYINRRTSATDSNAKSSRSHSILTLYLNGRNIKTNKLYNGKLHFVDLAGSERVDKSGVTGIGKEEAIAINSSLSALGDVIQALSKKEKFIPYRNSELTKLLQESLGGNSKTVMFINISPCKHSMSETVSSLRFATRAHQVEMGKATKNETSDTQEVAQIKNKMADLESKFKSGAKAAPAANMKAPVKPGAKK
eukprot:c20735_g4_i1.p1 GENE.c20735_g4_i1~~c20735_g4_i1.p1  ORF type:complete len:1006 (-),score=426.56 c20735_g4_i1:66-3083(-)